MDFQCGDEITFKSRMHGDRNGFYGGIRDDGGLVLFIYQGDKLTRCYWPAAQAELLKLEKWIPESCPVPAKIGH